MPLPSFPSKRSPISGTWDSQVYWERAQHWRDAAAALPPGEMRDAYFSLGDGYEKLASLIELRRKSRADQVCILRCC